MSRKSAETAGQGPATEAEPLTGRAQRLASLLRAGRGKRRHLDSLWGLLDEADPAGALSVWRRHHLAAVLEELAQAEIIQLPSARSYDRTENPALPRFITVHNGHTRGDRSEASPDVVRCGHSSAAGAGPAIVWHSALSWATETALTTKQREALSQINDWLFRRRSGPPIPVRERSLEIFGDEKALDSLLVTSLFGESRLSLETLNARRVVPRLSTERVGDGSILLVVENSDTVDSLIRALAENPGEIGLVGWGAGAGFEASVLSVPTVVKVHSGHTISAIRYFGDLDGMGLRIPAHADRLARASGLPEVRPAVGLYDALLEVGQAQPAQSPVSAEAADELTAWLPAHQRNAVAALLRDGLRIAQEAVGLEYLTAHAGWRTHQP